jgi:DNA-directed RNA polymerase subunit M/transcription elongation factor TFIIS
MTDRSAMTTMTTMTTMTMTTKTPAEVKAYYAKHHETIYGAGLTNEWANAAFADLRLLELEYDDFTEKPVEVVEGFLTCRKCKSNKVLSLTRQCRAADEPTSVFAQCTNCKSRWVQN